MSPRSPAVPPTLLSVAIEQIRVAGLLLRPVMLGCAVLLLLFATLVLTEATRADPVDLLPNRFGKLGLLVVMLAPILWRHDEPGRRGYLLAMPADRVRHQLLRSGAGWMWTMALVAGVLATFLAMTALTGGSVAVWQPGISLSGTEGWPGYQEAMAALGELDLQRRQPLPAWQWAVPFVAATALFLLGNAVAMARNAALFWIVGAYFLFNLLHAATEASAPAVHLWLSTVIDGRYGLQTLLTGNLRHLTHTLELSGGPVPVHTLQPDLAAWLGSVALWLLIAVLATAFALRGHLRPARAAGA